MSDPVDIYIACAAHLAKSARANGVSFTLLTNQSNYLKRRLESLSLEGLSIEEISFSRNVPLIKNYYSAHFKLDAIGALASGNYGKYVALVDIDTVFLGPLTDAVRLAMKDGIAALDVSYDVRPLYLADRIRRDLELIAGCELDHPRWFGGEFLASTDIQMKRLYEEIQVFWPRYVKNIRSVHHVGDEMVVSAALNSLSQNGLAVIDAGSQNIVARWWSGRTKYKQPALSALGMHTILHLPSDKQFLARRSREPYTNGSFISAYRNYVRRRNRLRRVFDPIDPWILARVE